MKPCQRKERKGRVERRKEGEGEGKERKERRKRRKKRRRGKRGRGGGKRRGRKGALDEACADCRTETWQCSLAGNAMPTVDLTAQLLNLKTMRRPKY